MSDNYEDLIRQLDDLDDLDEEDIPSPECMEATRDRLTLVHLMMDIPKGHVTFDGEHGIRIEWDAGDVSVRYNASFDPFDNRSYIFLKEGIVPHTDKLMAAPVLASYLRKLPKPDSETS